MRKLFLLTAVVILMALSMSAAIRSLTPALLAEDALERARASIENFHQ